MNLVILTQYYPPEIGAPQARLSELALRFKKRGHRVTVLTAMPNYPLGTIHKGYGGLFAQEMLNGIPIIRTYIYPTNKTDFVRRLLNYFTFVLSSAAIGAVLLRNVDYLLVESPPLFLGITGIFLSRIKNARLIFNVSDLWPDSILRLGKIKQNSLAYRISYRLEEYCYRIAWLVSGQSHGILDNVKKRAPKTHYFHLSNGVDTEIFKPELRSKKLRLKYGNENSCLAVYTGLHGVAQGLEQVLAAVYQVRDIKELVVIFVGEGPEKLNLEQRARELRLENIKFL